VVGHLGRAHGAEEDGVEGFQLHQAAVGDVGAFFEITLRAPVEVLEFQPEAFFFCENLQHLDARGDHFDADSVTRDRCNSIRFHCLNLPNGETGRHGPRDLDAGAEEIARLLF
jgi:hypothetical protein